MDRHQAAVDLSRQLIGPEVLFVVPEGGAPEDQPALRRDVAHSTPMFVSRRRCVPAHVQTSSNIRVCGVIMNP